MSPPWAEAEAALRLVEKVVADGPRAAHDEVAAVARCTAALRDHTVEAWRHGKTSRAVLDHANALVSLCYGAEAPLIGFHLDRLQQTRDELRRHLALARGDACDDGPGADGRDA